MNATVLWIIAAAAALLGVAAIGLFLSRARLRERIAVLEAGKVALEARLQLVKATGRAGAAMTSRNETETETGAPARARKEMKDDEKRRQDLLSLRRDLASARDEARKAQADVRAREAQVREARESAESTLYVLREENKSLLEQLREKEAVARSVATAGASATAVAQDAARAAIAPRAAEGRSGNGEQDAESVRELKRELSTARARLSDFERRDARDDARLKEALAKLTDAERELRRFREAASLEGGKVLDPVLYARWRERALEGRRMYRMMRHLRDLSDLKLASYQSAVERLASAFLVARGAMPQESEGGGARSGSRADLLLRAALEHVPPPREIPDAELPDPEAVGAIEAIGASRAAATAGGATAATAPPGNTVATPPTTT